MGTARTKANLKFNRKAYDRLFPTTLKGKKAFYEVAATEAGKSLNDFIITAIEEKIKSESPDIYNAMLDNYKRVAASIAAGADFSQIKSLQDIESLLQK